MPDKKLTDAEIVKALEDTLHRIKGAEHLIVPKEGVENLCNGLQTALDLINRQKAVIKNLTSGKCVYLSDDETTEYCVEGPCPNYKTEAQIKAEAYKECIEKVEEIICNNTYPDFDINHKAVNIWKAEAYKDIDNLLKELVGEQPILNDVKCIDCEYLELELPYAVCSKAYKGIVAPDDSCGKGKLKETEGDNDA